MTNKHKLIKIITLILLTLLIWESFLLYENFEKIKMLDETVNNLTNLSKNQEEIISQLEQNISRTETILKNETLTRQRLEKEIINLTMVTKREYGVMAVDDNNEGHLIPLEVIIKKGNGNLFLNVANVLFDEPLQSSAQTAIKVARDVTRVNLMDKDILINIESPVQEQRILISGGSAGGAMALATIAAMEGKTIRKDVLITGSIKEDHSIGRIGEARAKAIAAKENGAVLFLVPRGQKSEIGDAGIEVIEVDTIEEAMKYAIS